MIVLRKPGKPKYNTAKSHRPIALLPVDKKIFTALLTEDLIYMAENHNLLPAMHFGGLPRQTTTDALHLLVHTVKKA